MFPNPLIVWFLATTVRILSVRRIHSVVRDWVVRVSGTPSEDTTEGEAAIEVDHQRHRHHETEGDSDFTEEKTA